MSIWRAAFNAVIHALSIRSRIKKTSVLDRGQTRRLGEPTSQTRQKYEGDWRDNMP